MAKKAAGAKPPQVKKKAGDNSPPLNIPSENAPKQEVAKKAQEKPATKTGSATLRKFDKFKKRG